VAVDRDDGDTTPDAAVGSGSSSGSSPDREIGGRDEPDRAAAPTGRSGDSPTLRDLQIAEHVRYRESVEAGYRAAESGDAWARAAPLMRAEWEAHKQRYPDREAHAGRTLSDGAWVGEGDRRLSPEQNAEAAKCAADLRDEAISRIGPAMDRIEAADPGRRLAGREHMLKGEDRLKEKMADELRAPDITVRQALGKVADGVRFTLEYPSERYAEGVLADVNRIKAEGFQLIKLKNLWHADQYKGVNSQWLAPETGTRCEIQFHTPESLDAKELTHQAYERIRGQSLSPEEERGLTDFQRRANALLVTPPGTDRIRNFPE
jgi:hypothetical protein